MNTSDRLDLQVDTLEVAAQPKHPLQAGPGAGSGTLSEVLRLLPPIPRDALLLGVANDGLPILLNLKDPVPGPVLIAGDSQTGKTRLLQIISQYVEQARDPESIRYTVITHKAMEWKRFNQALNCEGILGFHQGWTASYLNSLVDWAHSSKQDGQYLLLLVDGLEELASDDQLHQAFSWLLLRGPSRHIWPIVTSNVANAKSVEPWLNVFRTRLFGRMQDQSGDGRNALLTGPADFQFSNLQAGDQFVMRAGSDWLTFKLPALD